MTTCYIYLMENNQIGNYYRNNHSNGMELENKE